MVRNKTDKVIYYLKILSLLKFTWRLCRWIYEYWEAVEQYFKVKTQTFQEKHVPVPHCQKNFHLQWPGNESGPRGETPTSSCLSHGMGNVLGEEEW